LFAQAIFLLLQIYATTTAPSPAAISRITANRPILGFQVC